MAEQIELIDLASFQNDSTAVTAVNANNETIEAAFTDVLSLSGVAPNQMQSNLDMNSYQIINLPTPVALTAPVRLTDLTTFAGGGTINAIPAGGTTGQALTKTSNTNYAVGWSSVPTSPGTTVSGDVVTWNSTTGTATADSGILATNLVTLAGSQTLTNKSIAGSQITGTVAGANLAAINVAAGNVNGGVTGTLPVVNGGSGVGTSTGTGNNVLSISPTLTTANLIGTSTNDSAAAGSVGEYISSDVPTASAVSLSTTIPKTVTSISLTAGDWDVSGLVSFSNIAGSTVLTNAISSINTTTNAIAAAVEAWGTNSWYGSVTGSGPTLATGIVRLSLATTTTVYLIAVGTFTTSTANAYGLIRARRVR